MRPQRIDDEVAEKREFLEGAAKYNGTGSVRSSDTAPDGSPLRCLHRGGTLRGRNSGHRRREIESPLGVTRRYLEGCTSA